MLLPLSVSPYEIRPFVECEHGFNARGSEPSQMMPDRNAENRLTLWSRQLLIWGAAKARGTQDIAFHLFSPPPGEGPSRSHSREKLPCPWLSLYERNSGMAAQGLHTQA